jgi:colicin import membrane protein
MSAAALNRDPVNTPAAVLSVAVHLALFTFLFFGIRWQSKLPDAVVVELWDRPAVVEQPAPVETPKPEPQAEPKPEPKVEPKHEPKVEVKPVKPDIALEKEKKPPPKKKVEPKKVEPKKVEPNVKIDFDRVMRDRVTREMEQVSRPTRPLPLPAGPVVDASYANKIKTKIKGNVVLPADIKGNPEAIFDVTQLPTGEVLSARLRKSSGNRAYDEAVERAILKSSPLPKPDRPEQFERDLQLKFRPVE